MAGPLPNLPASRFSPVEPVGSGTFSTVYRARDAAGHPAAVKVLAARWAADAGVAWRFAAEHRRLARLDHPAFPAALEAGHTSDGRPYYAMALVEGVPPATGLPAGEVRRVLAAVADALAHLHGLGWVHGDLKRANLLVTGEHVTLLDLGLVAPAGERRDEVAGTLEYLAPEVFRRQPVQPAADLYALGVLGYELWTGRPPFTGTPAELVQAQLHGAPPALPVAEDAGLAALLRSLVAKQPAERPASALAVAAMLRHEPPPAHKQRGLVAGAFVGREDVLAAWQALLGPGGWLAIAGEPGAGKTRTLDELRPLAQAAGWRWAGAAARGAADMPMAPLRAVALQALAGHAPSAATAAWLAGETPVAWQDLDPASRQAALRLALAGDLVAAAGAGLAIGLDDWQLADAESRDMLLALRRATAQAPIAWAVAASEDAASRLVLPPLEEAEVLALLRSRLGAEPPAALAALMQTAARGNPGLVELLLEHLVATGQLRPGEAGWRLEAGADAALPADGQALWRARLQRLSPAALRLVTTAAVAWPVGPLAAPPLGRAAGQDDETLARALDEGVAAGVLVAVGPAYRLALSALVPLLDQDATALADALVDGLLDAEPVGLAYLAARGSRPALTARLAAEAGRRSLAQAAYPTAAELLQLARSQAPDDGSLALPLAEALRQLGKLDEAAVAYEAALALAPTAAAEVGLAKCLQMRGDYGAALMHLEAAMGLAADDRMRARVAVARSRILVFQGRGEEALAAGRSALGFAPADAPVVRAQALNVVGTLLLHADLAAAAEGMAMLLEALGLAEGLGDRMGAGYVLDNVGNAYMAVGAWRDGATAFARSVALYQEAGAQAEALAADLNLAIALGELGEAGRAGPLAADVARRARQGGRKFLEAAARGVEAQAAWQRGEPAAAAEPLREGLAIAAAIANRYLELHLQHHAIALALTTGRHADALAAIARARAIATEAHQADALARLEAFEAEALRQAGPPAPALALATQTLASPHHWVRHEAHRCLATLALAGHLAPPPPASEGPPPPPGPAHALHHARAAAAIAAGWDAPWHLEADRLLEARALAQAGEQAAAVALARGLQQPYARAGAALLVGSAEQAAAFVRQTLAPLADAEQEALLKAHGLEDLPALATRPTQAGLALSTERWLARLEALADAQDEAEIGRRALAGVVELMAADRGYMLLYEHGRLQRAITHGMRYDADEDAFSHTLAEHVLFGAEPLYLVDAAADPAWRDVASVATLALRTVLCLPLAVPGEILGVLYLDRASLDPVLGPADLHLLHGLASAAAGAIVRERARGQAVAARRRAEASAAFAGELARGRPREAALLRQALQLTGADRAFWLVPAGEGFQALAGLDARQQPLAYDPAAISQGILAHVQASREGVEILDMGAAEDWQARASIQALGLRTAWCLPLAHGALLYLDALTPPEGAPDAALLALAALVETADALG